MLDKQIVVRVPESLKCKLELIAEAQQMKLADVCRAAFEAYVAPPAKPIPIIGEIDETGIKIWAGGIRP